MPETSTSVTEPAPIQEATFAGGCFWCVEAAFNQLHGVIEAESGYSNGDHPAPNYEVVCSGESGHAEVVKVRFKPDVISYEQLLAVFFSLHDPTTLNRQGHDVGTQYRSAIFTHNADQDQVARSFMAALRRDQVFDAPIVTQLEPLANYHAAEPYHQRYYEHHPGQGYCAVVIAPKLEKLRRHFTGLLRAPGAE